MGRNDGTGSAHFELLVFPYNLNHLMDIDWSMTLSLIRIEFIKWPSFSRSFIFLLDWAIPV